MKKYVEQFVSVFSISYASLFYNETTLFTIPLVDLYYANIKITVQDTQYALILCP